MGINENLKQCSRTQLRSRSIFYPKGACNIWLRYAKWRHGSLYMYTFENIYRLPCIMESSIGLKKKPYLLEFLQNFKITKRMEVKTMAARARRTGSVPVLFISNILLPVSVTWRSKYYWCMHKFHRIMLF